MAKAPVYIVIPALDPPAQFEAYVRQLLAAGVDHILLVDDGSSKDHAAVFAILEALGTADAPVTVLRHPVNMGKGRALKDAMLYLLEHAQPLAGIITADSDGQHTAADVLRVKAALAAQTRPALLLGARDFAAAGVPPKSLMGNRITAAVFRALYGVWVPDTQTGLRGIPAEFLPAYSALAGDRFEYEMNMLVYAALHGQKIESLPIETVYHENNKGTHFRAVRDSARVYGIIFGGFFKYIFSSLSASVLDIGCFRALLWLLTGRGMGEGSSIFVSTLLARLLSSAYNFAVNRRVVFKSGGDMRRQAVRYYLLCAVQMLCSAGLVWVLSACLPWDAAIVKILVDTVLFFISYRIQQRWVFRIGEV